MINLYHATLYLQPWTVLLISFWSMYWLDDELRFIVRVILLIHIQFFCSASKMFRLCSLPPFHYTFTLKKIHYTVISQQNVLLIISLNNLLIQFIYLCLNVLSSIQNIINMVEKKTGGIHITADSKSPINVYIWVLYTQWIF